LRSHFEYILVVVVDLPSPHGVEARQITASVFSFKDKECISYFFLIIRSERFQSRPTTVFDHLRISIII